MGNTHFSIYTLSWFAWTSSGTASKTEEFHPLETHTVEVQHVFGPITSWIYLSLFLWGHPPMTAQDKEMRPCVRKPCPHPRESCFSWEMSSGAGGCLQVPKYYSNSSHSNQSLKTCIYHPVLKTISSLLKPSCECGFILRELTLPFRRHTAPSSVPSAIP